MDHDSVWRVGLLHKLLQTNVGGCNNNLIKSFYFNSTCTIKIVQKQTRPFRYARGVRQGCILHVSPMLFNLYINDLPSACENTLSGPFVLPNLTKLNFLFYADDLIILSRFKTGLQNCLVFLLCFVDDENQSHARKLRLCSFRNVPGKTVELRFLIDGQIINVQEYNDDEEMIVAVNARRLKKIQWGLNP